jgi:putative heme-binding domain-containing protein
VVDAFQPALGLKGDAAAGRVIFSQRCVSCHHLGGLGFAVGPDLLSARSNGKDKLLISILDPSREVAPQYLAFSIATKDGESYVGILANETAASVTVRQAFGKEDVIMRSNIAGMKAQGQSLMPEGLEAGLTPQDLANVLEFITTAGADK